MRPYFRGKLYLMVLVLNDLDVVKMLVYMCVGNVNNGGSFGSQPTSLNKVLDVTLNLLCRSDWRMPEMSSNFFFPAVGRLNLLINVHLTFFFFKWLNFPFLWISFVVLEASKIFYFCKCVLNEGSDSSGSVSKSKLVIYFNYNKFECAAQNFCNWLILQVQFCLKQEGHLFVTLLHTETCIYYSI